MITIFIQPGQFIRTAGFFCLTWKLQN